MRIIARGNATAAVRIIVFIYVCAVIFLFSGIYHSVYAEDLNNDNKTCDVEVLIGPVDPSSFEAVCEELENDGKIRSAIISADRMIITVDGDYNYDAFTEMLDATIKKYLDPSVQERYLGIGKYSFIVSDTITVAENNEYPFYAKWIIDRIDFTMIDQLECGINLKYRDLNGSDGKRYVSIPENFRADNEGWLFYGITLYDIENEDNNCEQREGIDIEGGKDYVIKLYIMKKSHEYSLMDNAVITVNGRKVEDAVIEGNNIVIEQTVPACHKWGEWILKTAPTYSSEGEEVRVCDGCKSEESRSVPKLDPPKKENPVSNNRIFAKAVPRKNGKAKITWTTVPGADRYVVYFAECNKGKKQNRFKRIAELDAGKHSYTVKKLKKKEYKFYVAAVGRKGGVNRNIAKSPVGHFFQNAKGKYTNPKSIKLRKALTLKQGNRKKLSPKLTKKSKTGKLLNHAAKFRYFSSDANIASVSKKGVIKAKNKGTCYIYVVAINGIHKSVKITVR